jgi:hypothetical protein
MRSLRAGIGGGNCWVVVDDKRNPEQTLLYIQSSSPPSSLGIKGSQTP